MLRHRRGSSAASDAKDRQAIIAVWERLGRPWVCDALGGEIGDLPRWLEEHEREAWGSVLWALSIWKKQTAKGRTTERYWARSTVVLMDEPAADAPE